MEHAMPHRAITTFASANADSETNVVTTTRRNANLGYGTDIAKTTFKDNAHLHIGKMTYQMHLEHTMTMTTTVNHLHTSHPIRTTKVPHNAGGHHNAGGTPNAGGTHNPGGHHDPGGIRIKPHTIQALRSRNRLIETIATTTNRSGHEDDHPIDKSL